MSELVEPGNIDTLPPWARVRIRELEAAVERKRESLRVDRAVIERARDTIDTLTEERNAARRERDEEREKGIRFAAKSVSIGLKHEQAMKLLREICFSERGTHWHAVMEGQDFLNTAKTEKTGE